MPKNELIRLHSAWRGLTACAKATAVRRSLAAKPDLKVGPTYPAAKPDRKVGPTYLSCLPYFFAINFSISSITRFIARIVSSSGSSVVMSTPASFNSSIGYFEPPALRNVR